MNFSKLSYDLTSKLSKLEKKNEGIFFTPSNTVIDNIKLIKKIYPDIKNILEPSCGSGEFITELSKEFPEATIKGVENNKIIYNGIKHLSKGNITIINKDFLSYNEKLEYDLIIGNPPYFVISKKIVDKKYHGFFDGRPNIFILFIIKCIQMLKKDGILSFILPKSFINCLYYDKTREFINDNMTIIDISYCKDKYIETEQDTIRFIIQNRKPEKQSEFSLKLHDYILFGTIEDIKTLKELLKNSKNLAELGFTVNVGTVVWNQCKDILTSDNTKTRLIYSSDIKDGKLILKHYSNEEKKNYINKKGQNNPLLVINRGWGVGDYNFEYCLIEGNIEYLIENHLICINYTKEITNEKLIEMYKKIIKSFENKNTSKFIELYFGNGAINTSELNYIIPIYDF